MEGVHNLLRNFLAGISSFLLFFTVSLFLVVWCGFLSIVYPFLSLITFLVFFVSALYEKTRIRKSRRQELQELSRLLQKGERKAIEKGKHLIREFLAKREYLNTVKILSILSYTQIWEESIKFLREGMEELSDKEIHKLTRVFIASFKTENKDRKLFLFRRLSEVSEKLVREPNVRYNIKKKIKSALKKLKGEEG